MDTGRVFIGEGNNLGQCVRLMRTLEAREKEGTRVKYPGNGETKNGETRR